jgi:hypothetical protein
MTLSISQLARGTLLGLTLAGLGAGMGVAGAADSIPATGSLNFAVLRKGSTIGSQVITFTKTSAGMQVHLTTDIKVKVPVIGVTAYSYQQDSTENWAGDHLTALASKTDDNGTAQNLTLGPGALLPASLWDADILHAKQLVNTIDGHAMPISVQNLGADTVTVGAEQISATHYRISGELKRDLWFDADHRLVHVRFAADDGSTIDYALR